MRTLFKSCNLSEQAHDRLNGCAADGTTTTLTFHLVGARLTEAPVPHFRPTLWSLLISNQQRNFFHPNHCSNTPCLNIVTALMFRHAFHTFKVPRFPVPRFPPRATWSRVFQPLLDGLTFSSAAFSTPAFWSRVFQSRVFSVPIFSRSYCYTQWRNAAPYQWVNMSSFLTALQHNVDCLVPYH